MGRELRIALTSLSLVLASCAGGSTSDFPSDEQAPATSDGGAAGGESPANGNTGGFDNGGNDGDDGSTLDAGAPAAESDAGRQDAGDSSVHHGGDAGLDGSVDDGVDGGVDAGDSGALGL